MTIRDHYISVRKRTEEICRPLNTEDYVPQPAAFVSPPKWHLAHSTWFFEQFVLSEFIEDYNVFDTDFSFLFNSYYNLIGKRVMRADRGNITRPGVDEVYAYRSHVDQHMDKFLASDIDPSLRSIIQLGLNHEQQHQELLLTDIKFILGNNPVFPRYDSRLDWENEKNQTSGFVQIAEGVYDIGFESGEFCFDNELGRHKVYIHGFEISKALVTNGEFLEFMNAGGYQDPSFWLDEGWAWLNENKISAPMYWHNVDAQWMNYTMGGFKNIDENAMLTHISFYEAAAFADWKKMRLPTEYEWEAAADRLQWGKRWEWTNSAYLPYPGFKKPEGAIGEYNGKFMINQMVLRGASVATSEDHSRKTYRNFFHPDERWQFTGIRLAK